MRMACAWWWIMPDMNRMSASVYGWRTLSALAFAMAASSPCEAAAGWRPVRVAWLHAERAITANTAAAIARAFGVLRGIEWVDVRRSGGGLGPRRCGPAFRVCLSRWGVRDSESAYGPVAEASR